MLLSKSYCGTAHFHVIPLSLYYRAGLGSMVVEEIQVPNRFVGLSKLQKIYYKHIFNPLRVGSEVFHLMLTPWSQVTYEIFHLTMFYSC